MTHRHEWEFVGSHYGAWFAQCMICKDRLLTIEIERRLNACEVLSAERARGYTRALRAAMPVEFQRAEEFLEWLVEYANILEGK